MRLIPDQISSTTQSSAERKLFDWLGAADAPGWSYALHSLNLAEHIWKRVSEIDFLLVGSRGIYVLEVKGGQISASQGVWRHTDRFGRVHRKRESPFSQARSAMFSLQQRLEKHLPRELRNATFGYAVAFPDCDFDVESVEWDREMFIDRRDLERPDGLQRALGRMTSYWQGKPGPRHQSLADSTISDLVAYLRPEYEVVPTLARVSADAERELARLTSGQFRALDANSRNQRIIFEGGAGTGKTILAAELARRERNRGNRVLYTCRSSVMTGFIAQQPDMDGVSIHPLQRVTGGKGPVYDTVILDEGQDAINFMDLNLLDEVLQGGLENGRWCIFLDSNNQRGLVGAYEPDAMDYIRSFRPAEVLLADNCRNTREIVERTQTLTGADTGSSAAGTGPEVRIVGAHSPDQVARMAAQYLDLIEADGVTPGDITLLSGKQLRESSFERLPAKWRRRIDVLDLRRVTGRSATRLGFATIADFKGLESRFVLAADIDSPDQYNPKSNLYVAMTRARVGLWLALDEGAAGIETALAGRGSNGPGR
jgi:hypothetical protein